MLQSKITKIFIIGLLSLPAVLGAQPHHDEKGKDEKWKQIESAKIAFFTTELDLSPEEAQVFWPVYNQYCDEIWKARRDSRDALHKMRESLGNDSCTDTQIKESITAYIESCEKDDEVQKKYFEKFVVLLPVEKVAKLYIAEEDFRHRMIDMFKKPEHDKRNIHK